jgi:hypothetical protein
MRQQEFPHNTPEQVYEYLRDAISAVEGLDPPEDLRPLVFAKAVDLFSAKQLIFEESPMIPNLRPH